MEKCRFHRSDQFQHWEQVRIMKMPPNCTSQHELIDVEIILICKQNYRSLLPRMLVMDNETRESRREAKNCLPAGVKRIADCLYSHMVDVFAWWNNAGMLYLVSP